MVAVIMTLLRMPKGLWADFEETIVQQDRQFLTEVAKSLGLPVPEVLRRVLGLGAPQAVLIGHDETAACPYWDQHGEGLWKPCARLRLTETQPCHLHSHPSHLSCLGSDARLASLPVAVAFQYENTIYWVTDSDVFREDGISVPLHFKRDSAAGRSACSQATCHMTDINCHISVI
jgi:hypothetical protein